MPQSCGSQDSGTFSYIPFVCTLTGNYLSPKLSKTQSSVAPLRSSLSALYISIMQSIIPPLTTHLPTYSSLSWIRQINPHIYHLPLSKTHSADLRLSLYSPHLGALILISQAHVISPQIIPLLADYMNAISVQQAQIFMS